MFRTRKTRETRDTKVCALMMIVLLLVFSNANGEFDLATETYPICPYRCSCSSLNYLTNCNGKGLRVLPKYINREVAILLLADNYIDAIPKDLQQFPKLQQLSLKHNKITHLYEFELNSSSLEMLDLSSNNISDWNYVHNEFLKLATSIRELHLSSNPLGDVRNTSRLSSSSLETLSLRNCSIAHIPTSFLDELTNLQRLVLSQNLIFTIAGIKSMPLLHLDVSACRIHHVHVNTFDDLPSLESLNMRSNNQLKQFKSVTSESLQLLDVSNGNLEDINLSEFPNLVDVNLSDNHLRKITEKSFTNRKLQTLDLSHNAIDSIEKSAFYNLNSLRVLNLSTNTITDINPLSFIKNVQLKSLFLSRNYLTQVIKFSSPSLEILDLSVCEIQYIQYNSLASMKALRKVNLSRNLLKTLPNRMMSETLQHLDVSTCRLTDILNETFVKLKNLQALNLAGNRLTSGLKPEHFPKSLKQVILDDNLWHCECQSHNFRELNNYLRNMERHSNYYKLVCHSPVNTSGQHWSKACEHTWNNGNDALGHSGRVWLYALTTAFLLAVLFCTTITIRRSIQVKLLREEQERERMVAEAHERMRQLRLQQQREVAQQNAPDPRELVRPPSYAEAVLMPRPDGSYSSLAAAAAIPISIPERDAAPQSSRRKSRRHRKRSDTGGESGSGAGGSNEVPNTRTNTEPIMSVAHSHSDTDASTDDGDADGQTTKRLQRKTLESNL